ncbi:MAG: hypothetical protein M3O46_08810 [Myxococcota bacterium]|nr:hypothetical protein [Myxococcota bacterium]
MTCFAVRVKAWIDGVKQFAARLKSMEPRGDALCAAGKGALSHGLKRFTPRVKGFTPASGGIKPRGDALCAVR